MTSLFASLPAPLHQAVDHEEEETTSSSSSSLQQSTSSLSLTTTSIPAYPLRKSWRPKTLEDFVDGGSYPECHVAQYPLDMGRRAKTTSGNTLALQVDSEGNVRYDAIAQQGHRDGRTVQSQFKDLVPMAHRTDLDPDALLMERPSEDEVALTAGRTKAALEKLVSGKIKAAQPKHVPDVQGAVSYVRYTPQQGDGQKQRIIKMVEVTVDPLDPPMFKGKKIPRGPPSPPAPILRSPPRKTTAQDQKDWMIPPCVSNWKNNKGYTVPLATRLAADGRGLQDVLINDRFAQFSEALYVADRHAREEVRQRSLMQQRIAAKEKESTEDKFRSMAQRAREERSGVVMPGASSRVVGAAGGEMPSALAAYGSDSDSDAGSEEAEEAQSEEDEKGAAEREEIRKERNRETQRKLRMSNMGTEQRAKVLARASGRDISEKIALGLAKPTLSKDSMLDSRLFNQEALAGNFADDDAYNLYDKPLFSGSSAAAAIYKPRGANIDDEGNEVALEEGISRSMQNDRFGLGVAGKNGFEGADNTEVRDGPVAFERDTADPFAIDAFLESAKAGAAKRGLDTSKDESARKRARD